MSATIEQKRELRRIARQRKKLRQRIEKARWRTGRRDWMVNDDELDVIIADEKGTGHHPAPVVKCSPAKPSEPVPLVEIAPLPPESAEQVFNLIRGGVQTWDSLTKQTRLDDESLGLALAELFNERRIRLRAGGDGRIYETARQ